MSTARRPRRRLPRRAGLLAIAGVLVAGSAVAATTPWNPEVGSKGGGPEGRRTLSRTHVPAAQVAALGVLRRGQTDRDRSTPTEDLLAALGSPGRGLRLGSVRLLRADDGSATVLTSVARLGDARYAPLIRDALCVSQTTGFTERERASRATVTSAGRKIPAPVPIGGSGCGSFEDLLRGRLRTVTTGLVPDGVARVEVKLTTGRVISAPVVDNYYVLPIDASNPGMPGSAQERRFRSVNGRRIDWVAPDGEVVRKNDIARTLRLARGS